MTKITGYQIKVRQVPLAGAVIASLLGLGTPAFAAAQSFETFRGPAYITGQFGSMQTTTTPGSPSQGLLMNNGNGTSTLLSPGGLPEVVATPR